MQYNKSVTTAVSSLIGAAPGRGSCPIQRPLPFDLIYTDYHGLAHLHGAMGLAFKYYQYDGGIFFAFFVANFVSFFFLKSTFNNLLTLYEKLYEQ